MLEGKTQSAAKACIIQRHQPFGFSWGHRPDNRTPMFACWASQRQKSQRTVISKALPGSGLVRLGAAHAGDNGVVQVIPFTGGATCQDRKSTRLNSSHSQISY